MTVLVTKMDQRKWREVAHVRPFRMEGAGRDRQ